MIATRQQRSASRRTKRSSMKTIVTQARARELFRRLHFAGATKGTRLPKPDVVEQNNNHIRCAFWRFDLKAWRCLSVTSVQFCNRRRLRLKHRQDGSIDLVCSEP